MFYNLDEKILDKIYDWLTLEYYSPYPRWGSSEQDERKLAILALNDMRSLYSGVGNNGWWEEDRVYYLEDLQDIIPYSMNQVLWQNEQIRRYNAQREQAREEWEECEGDDTWWDEQDNEFFEKNAPDIIKMQGNKDGKLYEYTKELFWDSVKWFVTNYAFQNEIRELNKLIREAKKISLYEARAPSIHPMITRSKVLKMEST